MSALMKNGSREVLQREYNVFEMKAFTEMILQTAASLSRRNTRGAEIL